MRTILNLGGDVRLHQPNICWYRDLFMFGLIFKSGVLFLVPVR